MSSLPIRYRDFYDVPRAFLVERAAKVYFFDSPFDEQLDEYAKTYTVYRLDGTITDFTDSRDWNSSALSGTIVGKVLVKDVHFDSSLRNSIDDAVFRLLPAE